VIPERWPGLSPLGIHRPLRCVKNRTKCSRAEFKTQLARRVQLLPSSRAVAKVDGKRRGSGVGRLEV
jgi:hypothetical protein